MKFQFSTFADFVMMNGHGPYVWACYTITLAVLVYLLVSPLVQRRRFINQQAKQQRIAKR
jgi:heme exporter protein D